MLVSGQVRKHAVDREMPQQPETTSVRPETTRKRELIETHLLLYHASVAHQCRTREQTLRIELPSVKRGGEDSVEMV